MDYSSLFIDGDDPKFIDSVSTHLKDGAPALHQMSPEQYVNRCREMWAECELDEVFTFKLIVDNLVLRQSGSKGLPWEGMEEVVAPFLSRCSSVLCEALKLGVPLRGAITAGQLILHKKTNTFLGLELVEAARLEKAQDWLGVALGASVRSEQLRIPFDPRLIRLYQPPLKTGTEELFSGLVLDWPQRWHELHGSTVADAVEALRTPGFDMYYDNAKMFIEQSEADPEWFLRAAPPDDR
jgi:hypothetical protein